MQIDADGEFVVKQKLQDITVLGVKKPKQVVFQGRPVEKWVYIQAQRKLVVSDIGGDLNGGAILAWK